MSTTATMTATGYELKITRTFDAPRELVWKAWTDAEMAKRWMGPRGFQATEFLTPEGVGSEWHLCMEGHIPGTELMAALRQAGKTLEFDPPRKLVYTFAWDDRSKVGLGPSPFQENIVTVLFEEQGGKTVMHFTQAPFATEGERDGHTGGWNSAFDRFAEFMLSEQPHRMSDPSEVPGELHLKRLFAAPKNLVFDAWTKPEMLAKWWGPKSGTNLVCEIDGRSAGPIRIHTQAPDGTIYLLAGKVIEFYPPYRLHFTSSPLDKSGNPLLEIWNSVFFADVDGGTSMSLDVHVRSMTAEAPQYVKGMKTEWDQSLDRLERYLQEKQL